MFARRFWAMVALAGLLGCTAPAPDADHQQSDHLNRLQHLLPADAILLGEQHDAPDHQRIHREVVETLASQGALAALILEMTEQGNSTEALSPQASEAAVRHALQWNNAVWPWRAYGPAVMAAVRAGVPVRGANLSAMQLRDAMGNAELDKQLSGPALKAQQQKIRRGHCELLPESQISPMTRVQIARDMAMAQAVLTATRAGKTVVLLAGSGHVDRSLGVPQHLPPDFIAKTVLLHAGPASDALSRADPFDQRWAAEPAPVVDYCSNISTRVPRPVLSGTPE